MLGLVERLNKIFFMNWRSHVLHEIVLVMPNYVINTITVISSLLPTKHEHFGNRDGMTDWIKQGDNRGNGQQDFYKRDLVPDPKGGGVCNRIEDVSCKNSVGVKIVNKNLLDVIVLNWLSTLDLFFSGEIERVKNQAVVFIVKIYPDKTDQQDVIPLVPVVVILDYANWLDN